MNPIDSANSVPSPSSARLPAVLPAAADMAAAAVSAGFAFLAISAGYALAGISFETATRVMTERAGTMAIVLAGLSTWFFLRGHYHRRIPFWSEAREVMQACLLALLVEGFLLYSGRADVSRLLTCSTWAIAPFTIMGLRHATKSIGRRLGVGFSRVLVVGHPDHVMYAESFLAADRHLGYQVADTMGPTSLSEITANIAASRADVVLMALSGHDEQESALAADLRLAGVSVMIMPPRMGLPAGLGVQYVLGEEALLFVDRADAVPGLAKAAKRGFDLVLSTAALALLLMPMLIVALLVKLDGGPAIFGHARVGEGGRLFACLKFRSMKVDAESQLEDLLRNDAVARAEWAATRKLRHDPRVTRLGLVLRKTGLDELPQLFNVLRGDMSLVGPRPVTTSEMDQYGAVAERYKRVRPGITGLWQVSGRSDTTYAQRVNLDAWYVANWSPWHDLVIIFKTIPAVLFRRGAY
ncbi:exopolysaccharide biosynthesis polyprenyl glycosylphosphotransferase [Agrobacterium rubi]|nr:exopolysaccharide biosynthesis polyprenyl glycosylphosphotransferase [Agrobacterium rubi]NTF24684.1 exopolysaccharide biosynthesis polyprenyl glycosylphosphotransferase [Agrobacterium rubi]